MAPRVLVTDYVFDSLDQEHAVLDPLGIELIVADGQDPELLSAAAAEVEGLLVCFASVPAEVVDAAAAGGCKVIARYGIGYDNIDLEAATRHGIVVTNVPDYCLDEVADHTLALLLASVRGVVSAARAVAADRWEFDPTPIHRLAGRRLAVVGLGGIGRRVAARAQAFSFEVVGYDPMVDEAPPGVALAATLEEAVGDADAVSLHVPLGPATADMIDAAVLATMRRQPLLINTSRGGLVDLDAALDALDRGVLSGLALDVTEPEPLPAGHPLRTHPRAIVTPHMAFHSIEATEELQRRAATEVARALRGERVEFPVNPEVLG
jgi:D-3-phosphoglycerate dehydrogenase